MIPTCYTTKDELAMMKRQGMCLLYDRLRGEDAIALYSEERVQERIQAEREACAKLAVDFIEKGKANRIATAIRARGNK